SIAKETEDVVYNTTYAVEGFLGGLQARQTSLHGRSHNSCYMMRDAWIQHTSRVTRRIRATNSLRTIAVAPQTLWSAIAKNGTRTSAPRSVHCSTSTSAGSSSSRTVTVI